MTNNLIKKVINASAGTGKTYRLSLEYLSIILKHKSDAEFSFKHIYVITFTRKATAEIREAVFQRIEDIVDKKDQNTILELQKITGNHLIEVDFIHLKEIYQLMLINKEDIQITTIDSFINTIFKCMIAPVLRISNYNIDENANYYLFPQLFETLLKSKQKELFRSFFNRQNARNFEDIRSLFHKLIQNRWLLYFIKQDDHSLMSRISAQNETALAEEYDCLIKSSVDLYTQYLSLVGDLFEQKKGADQSCNDWLSSDIKSILNITDPILFNDFSQKLISTIKNGIIFNNYHLFEKIVKNNKFWNGTKTRSISDELKEFENHLAGILLHMFLNKFLSQEFKELMTVWEIILQHYDQLKFKEKIFTFDDILWFTFENLYKEEFGLIDWENQIVTNEFFEFLSNQIQYLLIDEFQDTGIMQLNIFKPLIKEIISGYGSFQQKGIIIVGDEKQSVYEWRGGDRNLLLQMPKLIGIPNHENLSVCFRSNKQIIDLVNNLFNPDNFLHLADDTFKWQYDIGITAHHLDSDGLLLAMAYPYSRNSSQKNNSDSLEDSEESDELEQTDIKAISKINSYREFVEKMVCPYLPKNNLDKIAIVARTNKDLKSIEDILQEKNIPCVRESSQSLFDHPFIKSVIHLLRFITLNDWMSFLSFLRSDIMLIHGKEFRDIVLLIGNFQKNLISCQDLLLELNSYPEIEKIITLKDKLNPKSVSDENQDSLYNYNLMADLILFLTHQFNMFDVFANENEIKNFHIFLEKVYEFDKSPAPYTHSLDGFILYMNELEKMETYKQSGIKIDNAIDLLTIHKSKGLSYQTTFVYYDITQHNMSDKSLLFSSFPDDSTTSLKSYFVTLNYASTLLNLMPGLKSDIRKKGYLEELNNLYVALTRAEKNLGIFFACCLNKNQSAPESDTPGKTLWNILFKDNFTISSGSFNKTNTSIEKESINSAFNAFQYFKPLSDIDVTYKKTASKEFVQNKYDLFLNKKAGLKGSVIHEYLSFIYYNLELEHERALNQTLNKFGNLMNYEEISDLCLIAKNFTKDNNEIYSKKWDKIFNEFELNDDGKVYRIDRLMIDSANAIILIVDYKTGTFKEDQLEKYASIIMKIPAFSSQKYVLKTQYISLDLNN